MQCHIPGQIPRSIHLYPDSDCIICCLLHIIWMYLLCCFWPTSTNVILKIILVVAFLSSDSIVTKLGACNAVCCHFLTNLLHITICRHFYSIPQLINVFGGQYQWHGWTFCILECQLSCYLDCSMLCYFTCLSPYNKRHVQQDNICQYHTW